MPIPVQYRENLTLSIGNILRDEKDFESVVKKATGNVPTVAYTTVKPRVEQIHDILKKLEKQDIERWLLAFVVVFAHWDHKFRYLVFKASPSTLDSSIRLDEQVGSLVAKLQEIFASPISQELHDGVRQKAGEFGDLLREIETLLLHKELYERLHVVKTRLSRGTMLEPKESIAMIVAACANAAKINDTERLNKSIKLNDAELTAINKLGELAQQAKAELDANKIDTGRAVLLSLEQLVQERLSTVNKSIFDLANKLSLSFLIEDPPAEFVNLADALKIPIRNVIPTMLARVLVRKVWQEASNELALIKRSLEEGRITNSTEFSAHWFALKSRIRWLTDLEANTEWSRDVNERATAVDNMLTAAFEPVKEKIKSFDGIGPFEAYRAAFERGFPTIMLKFDFKSVADINQGLRQILQAVGVIND